MTKKELKQPDEVLTFLGTLTMFISENQTKLMALAVSVFLLISAIYGYRTYTSQKVSKENGKLWDMVSKLPDNYLDLNEGEKQNLVILKSELEDFSRSVSSKSALVYAKYYIADVNFRLGYYANAVETYQDILKQEDIPGELRYISNLGLGYSYEALMEFEPAAQHYQIAGDIAIGSYNRGMALYGMARCYELMGDINMARQVYGEIIEKNPDYPDIEFIKIRLSAIS